MTLKVHLQTGGFICPKCGALLKEEDSACPKCGEKFEGVREGKRCPSCGTINDVDSVICAACGYSFGAPRERAMSDEEFLQKLLNWSKTLAEEEERDYQEEAERVVSVFKKVTGIELQDSDDEEGEVDWNRRVERNRGFIRSFIEILEEERKVVEKKLSNARKADTKATLEEDLKAIDHEIKGLSRLYQDLGDMKDWYDSQLKKAEDEKIEKERELRKEIAKVRKESIAHEEEMRELINNLSEEIASLRKRVGESVSATSLADDWIKLEKKLEKELKALEKEEKDEKVQKYVFRVKEEMKVLLTAVKMRAEEEAELRRLLTVLDELLEALPNRKIKEFAESEDFRLYERILDRYHVGE